MNMYARVRRVTIAAWALAAGGLTVQAAFADEPIGQVTVQAERPAEKIVGRSGIGAPVKLVELRHRVSYADLDLKSDSGADSLRKRVHEVARNLCADLDRMYPPAETDGACKRKAEDAAAPQIEAAIAAARSGK